MRLTFQQLVSINLLNNFSIILVRPQLSSNIGSIARAMLNFGCTDLRLISPKDNWHDDKAIALATDAAFLLDQAKIFTNLVDAVAELNILFALTARTRFINKPLENIKNISNCSINDTNEKIGLIFGPENSGLSNEDLVLADKLFQIPTNKEFSSLNLAQAVAITLFQLFDEDINYKENPKASTKATKLELNNFFIHLQSSLEPTHFFQEENKKANMLRNIKNIFSRIDNLTHQEINTLRGIITELSKINSQN